MYIYILETILPYNISLFLKIYVKGFFNYYIPLQLFTFILIFYNLIPILIDIQNIHTHKHDTCYTLCMSIIKYIYLYIHTSMYSYILFGFSIYGFIESPMKIYHVNIFFELQEKYSGMQGT